MDRLFRKDRMRSDPSVIVPQHDRLNNATPDHLADQGSHMASHPLGLGTAPSFSTTATQPENIVGVADPLGLQIAYSPEFIEGEIILIHGLGGSAWKTWSKDRQAGSFWPRWLSEEDTLLAKFRLSTFGYNSKFKGSPSNLNLLDFAKDFLFQLENILLPNDVHCRPVVIISHSLGGLIAKKAFTLGQQDRQYERIISMVCGMVFLATPHRGSQYAKTLNSVLSTAPMGTSSKSYINNLVERSDVLQEINESFRNQCDTLLLCSFYETLKTNLGFARNYVVEKYSAILGYDNESSASMDADHQTICKYSGKDDPNFIKIMAVLHNWASQKLGDTNAHSLSIQEHLGTCSDAQVEDMLGVSYADAAFDSSTPSAPSPGDWLFQNSKFKSWLEDEEDCHYKCFYLTGSPGTGKSTLSHFTCHRLISRGFTVQYHRFDRTDQLKRTVSFCLRSIAAQIAWEVPEFKASVLGLYQRTGLKFSNQSDGFQTIWDRLFDGNLFKIQAASPLVWVLDGLDQSDAPAQLFSRLSSIQSRIPIRVLFISLPLRLLSDKQRVITHNIQASDTFEDMDTFVTESVQSALPGETDVQEFVQAEILRKAEGSFLWVKLVLEILQDNWHTSDDIKQALTEIPTGMLGTYACMVSSIEEQSLRNRQLAKQILSWVTCSWRPLSVPELEEALKSKFGNFTNLALTITQICGHFIVLDQKDKTKPLACMVHATAREYLTTSQGGQPPWIDTRLTHQLMAKSCLMYLSDDKWRKQLGNLSTASSNIHHPRPITSQNRLVQLSGKFPLLSYSTWHWAYHLSKYGGACQDIMEVLETFLLNYSLTWIQAIAVSGDMVHLTRSARYLKSYVKRNFKAAWSDTNWIQLWAIDFIRIASKFAPNLLREPSSVYRNIPLLCPTRSMIGKTFGLPRNGLLSVTGITMEAWEDCLASVLIDDDEYATQIVAGESQFFTVASSARLVTVWNAETCEKSHDFVHGGPVSRAALNGAGTLLATTTYENYYIWDTTSYTELCCVEKSPEHHTRIQDMVFDQRGHSIIAVYENLTIEKVMIDSGETVSTILNKSALDPEYIASPWWSSISPDCTKVVMAWRGRVPLLWDLEYSQFYKCRARDETDPLMYPQQLIWHPESGNVLILCNDTSLFEWQIFQDELISFPHVKARDIVISRDGDLLLTSDAQGTLNIWAFPSLNLVYSLSNSGDRVTDMTFSPDSQRFYDVRGSSCNIWTPDALIRTADQESEENSSQPGSTVATEPVISATSSTGSTVSAVTTHANPSFYVCGREDGTVCIHDTESGKRLRKVSSHPGSSKILHLCLSSQGRYLVSSDDTSLIVVKRLQLKDDGKWAVFPVMEKRVHAPVHQLLFSSDQKNLLISTSATYRLWCMKDKQETASVLHQDGQIGHWALTSRGELIMIKDRDIFAYEWDIKLKSTGSSSELVSLSRSIPGTECIVQSVVWSRPFNNGRNIFAALRHHEDFFLYGSRHYNEIRIASLSEGRWQVLPRAVTSQVKLLFAIVDDQVMFLGFDGWICSINLSPWITSTSMSQFAVDIRRHFYIPKDWINTPASHAAASNSQGTFFFPKQGEVAIVKNGLRF